MQDTTVKQEKERILLVDDSRVVRKMFSAFLSPKFECSEAGSFDEAIVELRASEFAVVITDIIMPGMSGIELLRKIVEDYPNTSVIVASGVDRPQRALDAVRLGAFDYLIKPCEKDALEFTVERALEQRKLVSDSRRYKLDLEKQNIELVTRSKQLERLQAQVMQNEKMASLGQLAAGVAHELNNPVGFVQANLEMLEQYIAALLQLIRFYDETVIPQAVRVEADAIKQQIGYTQIAGEIASMIMDSREGSNRISDIVKNLQTFSRLDGAEFKESDLHEGIDATVRLLSRYFTTGNIELSREYEELPSVGILSGQMNQVWMNLLVNAAQSIGTAPGTVKIETRSDDENVYVAIRDTGCGIPVQDLKRIFDPFYTTKPVGEGTGLGLSISFSIVKQHGGDITVDTVMQQGTTFTVRLPRHFQPDLHLTERSIACYVGNQDQTTHDLYL